jgi:hypothetical protein
MISSEKRVEERKDPNKVKIAFLILTDSLFLFF